MQSSQAIVEILGSNMSDLNSTVSANRTHIGFFGLRNAGKSSVVNAITNQSMSLVSDIKGTTTDPVKKSMEILPIGPVVIVDTPGMDDEGTLGELRIKRTLEVLKTIDMAVLVVDANVGLQKIDLDLIDMFKENKLPYFIAFNKCDLIEEKKELASNEIYVSALNNDNIDGLKQLLASVVKKQEEKTIIKDLIKTGDVVVLVIPIDKSAPKGRLILPQQLVLRDILDHHAIGMTCQVEELEETLKRVTPKLVITDSQAFNKVSQIVDKSIHLTSFSILMARLKGSLATVLEGANKLDHLQDGDCILISEGCTHHRQCGDIGTDKLPKWILNYTKKNVTFEFTSGHGFKEDLSKYSVVIHCGACMLNEKEVQSRVKECKKQGVPFTNYGIAIAKMNGILDRSVEVF